MIAVLAKTSHDFLIDQAIERNEAVKCQGKIHKLDLNMLESWADSLELHYLNWPRGINGHSHSLSSPFLVTVSLDFNGVLKCHRCSTGETQENVYVRCPTLGARLSIDMNTHVNMNTSIDRSKTYHI